MRSAPDFLTSDDDIAPHIEPTSKEDAGFVEYYEREIRPVLLEMEKERGTIVAKTQWKKPLGCLLAILAPIPFLWLATKNVELGMLLLFLTWGGIVAWVTVGKRAFMKKHRDELLPRVVRYFGNDFTYTGRAHINASTITASKIVPVGSTLVVKDEILGTYKGVRLSATQILVKDGVEHDTVVFRGLFVSITFPKSFHGTTVVKRDVGQARVYAKAGDMETVSLEDPVFEKLFEVRSTDQVEARYLLTPDFMERILRLAEETKDTPAPWPFGRANLLEKAPILQCSFIERTLYISIPTTNDRFVLDSLGRHTADFSQVMKVYREIRDILSIIDILELKQRNHT